MFSESTISISGFKKDCLKSEEILYRKLYINNTSDFESS